jgi:hypothetical protein
VLLFSEGTGIKQYDNATKMKLKKQNEKNYICSKLKTKP